MIVNVLENGTTTVEIIQDNLPNTVEVLQSSAPNVVEIVTAGPQGPVGPTGPVGPVGPTVDTGSFAITGSNTFIGTQVVSGSLRLFESASFTLPTSQPATAVAGTAFFSGSFLYIYNGSAYKSASFS